MEKAISNQHERFFPVEAARIRAWLDHAWSGTEDDVFPHDRLPSWRQQGSDALFGHAGLVFRLREEEPLFWQADVVSTRFRGSQGFELFPRAGGTLVRHYLSGTLHRSLRWQWPTLVRPLHDWAVEALLDRLEAALSDGKPPASTEREMPAHARAAYRALLAARGGDLSSKLGLPRNWQTSNAERQQALACDTLVADPDHRMHRAVSIAASAEVVFRWLCQLKTAPYSYDWIDNWGRQSPIKLNPGLERLELGERVMTIFRLHSFEPGRSLTLVLDWPLGARIFGRLAVSYCVLPEPSQPSEPGQGERSRLLARLVVKYPNSTLGAALHELLPWGDLIMMRKQLLTLKALAETDAQKNTI